MNEAFHIDKADRYGEQRDVMLKTILRHILIGVGLVLDLGCGLGVFLETIQAYVKTGLDLDPECVEISRAHVPEANLIVSDACRIPFADRSFDAVVAVCLLEHVENPTALIREAHRVCRKGGLGIFVTPNIGRPLRLMLAAQKKEKWERSGHRQGWDVHLLTHCLENNGWRIRRMATRFVDCPFYTFLPRWLGNWLSHRFLPRLFPNIGSELYAFCVKN